MPKKEITESSELKKLRQIVSRIPPEKQKLAEGMIADASFMAEQLAMLREEIRKNGVSETYQNGANQSGTKQSVAMTTYLQVQKQYSITIRFLETLLPSDKESTTTAAGEALAAFVAKGKT